MFKNYWKHFKLITKHKYYVFKNCCYAGIPLQGILHDLSKYSPTEFLESVKNYSGDRSPIDNLKDKGEISMTWLHHRGRNKHHWEYWIDNLSDGPDALLMPEKYAIEMLCDFLGAGQAYMGKNWTMSSPYEWWQTKKDHCLMHPATKMFINNIFTLMKDNEFKYKNYLNPEFLRDSYKRCISYTKQAGIGKYWRN